MVVGKKTEVVEEAGCYTVTASSKEIGVKRLICSSCSHKKNCPLKK